MLWLDEFPIGFARPLWLLALLAIPLMLRMERISYVAMSRERRRWVRGLRFTILTLLIFALAGFQIVRTSNDLAVVFLIDRSDSTRDQLERALDDLVIARETMTPRDEAGVIIFGSDAYVESAPEPRPKLEDFETLAEASGTDLSRAIRLGLGVLPDDRQRRLVLVSDGNENLGDAIEEAKAAAASSVPIDVIPLNRDVDEEVLVESVELPESVDKDEPFEVRITVRSTVNGPAKLRLFRDDTMIESTDVELRLGKNIYVVEEVGALEGFRTYAATVEALQDTLRENNEAIGYTRIFGKPRVLLVGPDADRALIARAISQENWEVEESYDLPNRRVDAENYDAIVLANTGAENFSNNQISLVRDYVRDLAGGFIMVGGENSYGLGGYVDTPIEETLPVSMELKNKRYFPSLAMAIVMDKSGSMGMAVDSVGTTKMKIANEAAVASLSLLTDQDVAMVIAFDGQAKVVWNMDKVGGNRARIANQVLSISPGGGTDMYVGMKAATEALLTQQAQLKHMIVLGDGMTHGAQFPELCARAAQGGITISTVAIGQDADAGLMRTIASMAGGRFYETSDPFRVPRIFTKETYIAQRAYMVEETFTPSVFQENQIIKGLSEFPPVRGYIVTEPKDRAEMVLLSHKGDPLLGSWRFGLGKSVAFTSDAKSRWLAEWIGWDGFDQFWIQSIRWVMRQQERSELRPNITIERGKGKIVVDAVTDDDRYINFLEVAGRVTVPDRSDRVGGFDVPLRQTGPGRYEGEFDARDPGTYLVRVHGGEEQGIAAATAGTVLSYAPEYKDLNSNTILLNQIAATTNGRYAPQITDLFTREQKSVKSRYDLWWWLLMMAIVLFPADVAARRIFLDDEQKAALRKFGSRFLPSLPRRSIGGAPGSLATIEALRKTRGKKGKGGSVDDATIGAATSDAGVTSPPPEPTVSSGATGAAEAPSAAMLRAQQKANATTPDPTPRSAAPPRNEGGVSATLGRLRQATGSDKPKPGAPSNKPGGGEPAKPLIFRSKSDAPNPDAGGTAKPGGKEADGSLSATERLLRARDRARKKK